MFIEVIGKIIVGLAYLSLVIAIALNFDRFKVAVAIALIVTILALLLNFLNPVEALPYVDLDVIGLVIFASALSWFIENSELAKLIVSKSLKFAGRSIYMIVLVIGMISLFLSLWLENVTVVILMSPIILTIAKAFGISPIPLLIVSAFGSNLSGSALLCGDPQAIIVASAYRLSFIDFIIYNSRLSMFFIIMAGSIVSLLLIPKIIRIFDKEFYVKTKNGYSEIAIEEQKFSKYMLAVILALIAKVIFLSLRLQLGLSLTMCGALAVIPLLLIYWRRVRENVRDFIEKVLDVKLIGFYIAMFYLVGYLDVTGLTTDIAKSIEYLSGGSIVIYPSILVSISAIASSFIDNVPLVAAFVPIITKISIAFNIDKVVLAWAMLLGVTIGGGGTFIGCMASYAAVRIGERETGKRVSLAYYSKIAVPPTIIALIVGLAIYYISYLDYFL